MMLVLVLLCINVIAFLAFGWDKRQAERHLSRIPERTLLLLALLGGALGAAGATDLPAQNQETTFRYAVVGRGVGERGGGDRAFMERRRPRRRRSAAK